MPLANDGFDPSSAIFWTQKIDFHQVHRREGFKIVVCRWHMTVLILWRRLFGCNISMFARFMVVKVSQLSYAAGKWRFLFFSGELLDVKEQVERDPLL